MPDLTELQSTQAVILTDSSAVAVKVNTSLPGLSDGALTVREASQGQKTMANSQPVVIASDQSTLIISGTVTANAGTGTFTVGGTVTANAGTGTFNIAGTGTAGSAASGVVTVQGIASMTALKVDGSAVTQPVSGTVTANAGTGNFAVNIAQVNGSTVSTATTGVQKVGITDSAGNALNRGQQTSANSFPVVIASDQSDVGINIDKYGGTSTTLGQKASTSSIPVVIASDQSDVKVNFDQVAGSAVATAATGIIKVGLTDGSGSAVNKGQTTMSGSIPVTIASDQTPFGSLVSTSNSSTTTLTANSVFTGTAEDVSQYLAAEILVFSDQSSAANGLSLQFSSDNSHWDSTETHTITGNTASSFQTRLRARYFRIVYTNGGTGQTAFRLQTIYKPTFAQNAVPLSETVADGINTQVVKAIGVAKNIAQTGTTYPFVQSDSSGNLNVNTLSSPTEGFAILSASDFSQADTTLVWNVSLTGSGTTSLNANEAALFMTNTTASGDKVIKQTRLRFPYAISHERRIIIGALMGAIKTNVRQRLGYFTDRNGLFFEQDGTNLKVVWRTFATGSAVDTAITQANWNTDRLDGTGPSGITLDNTKIQQFVIDFTWAGAGTVSYGFVLNDSFVICHQIHFENLQTTQFMTKATLPVRFELENTGTAGSGTTMKVYSFAVMDDDVNDEAASTQHTIDVGAAGKTIQTSETVIISLRLKAANFDSVLDVENISIQMGGSGVAGYWQLILNPSLTGASFASVDATSIAEFDTAATSRTGGTVVASGYMATATAIFEFDSSTSSTLSSNIANTQDILTLVATAASRGTGYATMQFDEYL